MLAVVAVQHVHRHTTPSCRLAPAGVHVSPSTDKDTLKRPSTHLQLRVELLLLVLGPSCQRSCQQRLLPRRAVAGLGRRGSAAGATDGGYSCGSGRAVALLCARSSRGCSPVGGWLLC